MRLSRRSRYAAALLALVSLLFAQGALALYQCPNDDAARRVAAVAAPADDDMRSMPGCDGMDPVQPVLCQAHAQSGKQSLDKPPAPDVPAFIASGLFFVLDAVHSEAHPVVAQSDPALLTRTTAPPVAVRNCCFRI